MFKEATGKGSARAAAKSKATMKDFLNTSNLSVAAESDLHGALAGIGGRSASVSVIEPMQKVGGPSNSTFGSPSSSNIVVNKKFSGSTMSVENILTRSAATPERSRSVTFAGHTSVPSGGAHDTSVGEHSAADYAQLMNGAEESADAGDDHELELYLVVEWHNPQVGS